MRAKTHSQVETIPMARGIALRSRNSVSLWAIREVHMPPRSIDKYVGAEREPHIHHVCHLLLPLLSSRPACGHTSCCKQQEKSQAQLHQLHGIVFTGVVARKVTPLMESQSTVHGKRGSYRCLAALSL